MAPHWPKARDGGIDLEGWLRRREPEIPAPLLSKLLEESRGERASPEILYRRALSCLRRSLAAPGRNRPAAFDLLEGDAFLTYACELLARQDDPRSALAGLFVCLAEELS